ncbi:unnamed protein product [Pleuronectes platessa]|uniref:Uncharacterized protein n=1 Tax=Pleuronectes platessa TaxID=8262 RepID=A0A9N7USY4_PLEPL|nr:unnamed protein product [Pleuronectes platessa]
MAKKCAYRRQEVVRGKPMIAEFKIEWPGLFTVAEKEELHDASKRVRKASTSGDKGSCSGHVDERNRLEQETSAATASQLHRQLAKPGQEAGTAAAAGQVARQPERELATAPAVTDTQ